MHLPILEIMTCSGRVLRLQWICSSAFVRSFMTWKKTIILWHPDKSLWRQKNYLTFWCLYEKVPKTGLIHSKNILDTTTISMAWTCWNGWACDYLNGWACNYLWIDIVETTFDSRKLKHTFWSDMRLPPRTVDFLALTRFDMSFLSHSKIAPDSLAMNSPYNGWASVVQQNLNLFI